MRYKIRVSEFEVFSSVADPGFASGGYGENGGLGRSFQRGPGPKPLVGARKAKPLAEAESFISIFIKSGQKLRI